MTSRFCDLKNKEMICSEDGLRIGFVDDVEFDSETYTITHLITYGKYRLFGILGKYEDIRVCCEHIRIIGEDIILVEKYNREGQGKKVKKGFFSKFFE